MIEPILRIVEVPCPPAEAFAIFAAFDRWWPLDKRAMAMKDGKKATGLKVDARDGGRIVEQVEDGSEHHWGSFREMEAPLHLAIDFHMGMPKAMATNLELVFIGQDSGGTKVELTQDNWEACGEMAAMLRDGYEQSWGMLLEEAYAEACKG